MYESPQLTDIGTLADLTQVSHNKIGHHSDAYSAVILEATGISVVGSLVDTP
jgi:hypothetical protein